MIPPPVSQVKLNKREVTIIGSLSRRLGIYHRNVLCRIGLAISLADPKEPRILQPEDALPQGTIEISWETFSGSYGEIYSSLVRDHWIKSGSQQGLDDYFSALLSRGLARMSSIKSLDWFTSATFLK